MKKDDCQICVRRGCQTTQEYDCYELLDDYSDAELERYIEMRREEHKREWMRYARRNADPDFSIGYIRYIR